MQLFGRKVLIFKIFLTLPSSLFFYPIFNLFYPVSLSPSENKTSTINTPILSPIVAPQLRVFETLRSVASLIYTFPTLALLAPPHALHGLIK